MIEIDRLALTLPASLRHRAEGIARAAAQALAEGGPPPGAGRLRSLPGLEVRAGVGDDDASIGASIGAAIAGAIRGALPAGGGGAR